MSTSHLQLPAVLKNPLLAEKRLAQEPEAKWIARGELRALKLFQDMAERVPAYKDFLKKNHINPSTIKTISDFQQLPTVDKNNYLREYPLPALQWDGTVSDKRFTISSTSGSTGEPFYFPREISQDRQYAALAELYLRANFQIHKKSTLYVVGFPLGPWIGGIFTYEAIRMVAERGKYALSVVTPGVNPLEIIRSVQKLGPHFDQVIIGSYGPFLKDTLDEGVRLGVDWKQYNLGFVFSAEVFSENFREYVTRKTGIQNQYLRTLNHYGTVDLGTMSYETPLAIIARKITLTDPVLFEKVFDSAGRLPTLTQYIPELFYFESVNGNLLCSAYSGLPLVRYDLKDRGGVCTRAQLTEQFVAQNKDLGLEARRVGIEETQWNIPFVYVYERADLSVSFYAFFVYPETIRKALQQLQFEDEITTRFTMLVSEDKLHNPVLEIHVELKDAVEETAGLMQTIQNSIFTQLLTDSSEYRKTYEEKGTKVRPKIVFWPHRDGTYFNPVVKQKWVIR